MKKKYGTGQNNVSFITVLRDEEITLKRMSYGSHTGDYSFNKTSRKLVPHSSYESIDSYSTAVFKHLVLAQSDGNIPKGPSYGIYIPQLALQFLLQTVLESLVYFDRQFWLSENGCHGYIITVFDEFISQRNLARPDRLALLLER
ncbi:hypothetical protein DPMN_038521 [Dreissena polymorpha]|uniref:Uncharacterized protein n=1 Tax=Dreissena polymorpha TaxID=45954 RepID=A0A9D4MET2_DREPO|nr:hypothetical protein DPMN_038521 [Dreissena polymorpha]